MAKKWEYDENIDYQALINDAVKNKDYGSAARYEQQRNAKITDMDAAGTNKWGATVTNDYSQYLMPDGFQGSATGVGVNNPSQQNIQDMMNANSLAWWDATPEERENLHKQNEYLGSLLGGDIDFDAATGVWSGMAGAADAAGNLVGKGEMGFNFNGQKPSAEDPYWATLDEMYNKIVGRDPFSYNPETDPIYQQYAKTYMREGERAMNDTLAAMAAGAGGMNSYALGAAQQAQNYYGAQLADKVPELHQLAYDMYLRNLDNQIRDFELLEGHSNEWWGRQRDQMGDYYADYGNAYDAYWDDKSFDYKAEQDAQAFAKEQVDAILAAGGTPSKELIAASGYSPEYIAALQAMYAPKSGGYYTPVQPEEPEEEPDNKTYKIDGIGTVDPETALEMEEDGVIVITGTDKYGSPIFAPTGKYTDKKYPVRA